MESTNSLNWVKLSGKVATDPTYSHEAYGEKYYDFFLEVLRHSGKSDIIPIIISERFGLEKIVKGNSVTIIGQFRGFSQSLGDKYKLILQVFVKELKEDSELPEENLIKLEGYLCKQPLFRTTPLGRDICDLMVVVNRKPGKSDYLPCITWGRNAKFTKNMSIGTRVYLEGRIQSREYQKKLNENLEETRIAYEVSVNLIKLQGE